MFSIHKQELITNFKVEPKIENLLSMDFVAYVKDLLNELW